MLLLLPFLLSRRAGTCALPILTPRFLEPITHGPAFDIASTASTGACVGRSLWDILWSCLATTFACTWVSVHPNIPFFREGKASTRRWRLYLMFLSLIAPEIMILWAFKQLQGALVIMKTVNRSYSVVGGADSSETNETVSWAVAKEVDLGTNGVKKRVKIPKQRKKDNSPLWTLTHAHYLQMGGYRLQCLKSEKADIPSSFGRYATITVAGRDRTVWELPLSFETMKDAFNRHLLLDLPFIPRDEILDKNGRDGLSKAIAMLQLTWFIIQIAARVHQNLAVTELELTTAALASLNIAMYASWWSKPSDILCPTIIKTNGLQEQTRKWMRMESQPSHSDDPNGTRYNNSEVVQSTAPPLVTISPSLRTEDSSDTTMQYVITEVGDKEKVNLATHYWMELKNALRKSWSAFISFPGKLFDGLYRLAKEVVEQAHKIWSNPSPQNPSSDPKSSSDEARPSFFKKARNTIFLPWKTVTHLFLALIYYPILAILHSGKKLQIPDVEFGDDEVEEMATFKLIFDVKKLRLVMVMVFFCEDVASAPFLCLSAFSGAIFGMIHCLAWNFQFPSLVEEVMWRTCSSIIAGLCLCTMAIALVYIIIKIVKEIRDPDSSSRPSLSPRLTEISKIVCSTFAICFVVTRLSLLVLSIVGLRNLPDSAFDTVQWSGFIPHV